MGLCNVDTALSEIGSSKDVLTLHGISNPSGSLCALCRFHLGSPDFACSVLLLHPRVPANQRQPTPINTDLHSTLTKT